MPDNNPLPGQSSGRTPQHTPGTRRRRRRRASSGCLSSLTYIFFILGVSLVLSAVIIVSANEVFSFIKADVSATVEIPENAKASEVAKALKDAKIINNTFLFRLFSEFYDSDAAFNPGSYQLNAQMDYRAIANTLRHKSVSRDTVTVTIPEGTDFEKTVEILAEKGVCPKDELYNACKNVDFGYDFLENQPENVKYKLEGYLFPDTYEFYVNDNAENVFRKFLANFDRKYDASIEKYAESTGYTTHEIITVASLIEEEAKINAERAAIASVIYNRLKSDNFPNLQIDATILYCLPEHKEVLTNEDKEIDDPYNTYVAKGLPPGPICSPGLSSILAAVSPDSTKYYYYNLSGKGDGSHYFSKTLAEHQKNIEKAAAEKED